MPNQLSTPFKKTYVVPLREAVREYILSHYTDTHPDAYRWDVSQWEKLRAEAVSTTIHIDRVKALIRYVGVHTPPMAPVVLRAAHFLKLSRAARLHLDKASRRRERRSLSFALLIVTRLRRSASRSPTPQRSTVLLFQKRTGVSCTSDVVCSSISRPSTRSWAPPRIVQRHKG